MNTSLGGMGRSLPWATLTFHLSSGTALDFIRRFITSSTGRSHEKHSPHPRTRDKSFPVPSGRILRAGFWSSFIFSIVLRTHPIVPSPPATKTLTLTSLSLGFLLKCRIHSRPFSAGLSFRSITCVGFKMDLKALNILSPSLSPLVLLAMTTTGDQSEVGTNESQKESTTICLLPFDHIFLTFIPKGGTIRDLHLPKSHSSSVSKP